MSGAACRSGSWLRHALATVVVPAVRRTPGVSVWLMTTGEAGWIHRSPTCPAPPDGFPRVTEPPSPGGRWERYDLPLDRDPGTLWACLEPGAEPPRSLDLLVDAARTIAGLREEQEHLREELALTYENLSSVYEISANPELLLRSERALDLILERLASFDPGLEAVVWLLEGDRVVPRRWRAAVAPEARPAAAGIPGRVLASGRSLVDNHRTPGGDAGAPELSRARRVAAAPLGMRGRPRGVLEIWNEAPGRFDGRLLALLAAFATQAAMVIENEELRRREAAAIRATNEIDIASRMQQVLLQGAPPAALPGLEVGVASVAARGADGDFFEFFVRGDGSLDVLVGDVMGKGLPAALVGAAVKSEFLRFGSLAGAEGRGIPAPDPERIVARVHEAMSPRLEELACFVTATYHRVDPEAGRLTYVDCGHVPPMLARADGSVAFLRQEWERPVNLPLGLTEGEGFVAAEVQLDPGDVLVLYSDGLTEAVDPAGEMFGPERLAEVLRSCRQRAAPEVATALRRAVTAFAAGAPLRDDLTCVVIALTGPAAATAAFAPRLEALPAVRRFLAEATARAPWVVADPGLHFELVVAGVEWASNVMRHGGCDDGAGPLDVAVSADEATVRIEMVDRGRAFDLDAILPPDLEALRDGGLGLFLVRSYVSAIEYETLDDGRNRVRLVRRREPAPEVRSGPAPGR